MNVFRLTILLLLVVYPHAQPIRAQEIYEVGDHQETVMVDGLERQYILHIPPDITATAMPPLIIVLHGTYGTGRQMQIGLGFDYYADELGFLVAYPDAYDGMRWNDGRGTLDSSEQGIDDVAFILAMIADISDKTPVNMEQVFVTGASNGAIMSYRLGCETEGVFAGIAPVIGNIAMPILDDCTPQSPIALLSINGDEDPFIPFNGGEVCEDVRRGCEKGFVASVEESVGRFADANSCDSNPEIALRVPEIDDDTEIETRTYTNCDAAVISYIVRGGGHVWPPRVPRVRAGGTPTANLDATQVIVTFFIQNGLLTDS